MRLHLLHWFYKFAPKGLQHEYQQLNDCICTYTVSDKLDYSNNLQEINDRKDHPATNENYNNISLPLLVLSFQMTCAVEGSAVGVYIK